MYAHLSRKWVEDGCYTHIITLLAHDRDAIDAFFWMGFGLTNADAIRDMSPIEGWRASVEIRRASQEDTKAITAFNTRLPHDGSHFPLRRAPRSGELAGQSG